MDACGKIITFIAATLWNEVDWLGKGLHFLLIVVPGVLASPAMDALAIITGWSWVDSLSLPIWAAVAIIGAVFVIIFGKKAYRHEQKLNPILDVCFDKSDECFSQTIDTRPDGENPVDALYIKIKATNPSAVKISNCRPKITNIEKRNGSEFISLQMTDAIELSWSGGYENMTDFAAGETKYFGFIHMNAEMDCPKISKSKRPLLNRYKDLFSEPGEYKTTIKIFSNDSPPAKIIVVVLWFGEWNAFDGYRVGEKGNGAR